MPLLFFDEEELESYIIDRICHSVEYGADNEAQLISSLHPMIRMVYVISEYDGEINNGGFEQYFFNTNGIFCIYIEECLQMIGAHEHAKLFVAAYDIYCQDISKYSYNRTIDDFALNFSRIYDGHVFDKFNNLFFRVNEEEQLSKKRIAFIKSHIIQYQELVNQL